MTRKRWAGSARDFPQSLPDRRPDEAGAGQLPGGCTRQRQFPCPALSCQGHRQPGDRSRHRRIWSDRSSRARWPIWCCGIQRFFAVKPKMVLKGGMIAWANMGDPNASLPTPQPTYYRPMFGRFGTALPKTNISLRPAAAYDAGTCRNTACRASMVAGHQHMRVLGKEHMVPEQLPAEDRCQPGDVRRHGRRRPCDSDAAKDDLAQSTSISSAEAVMILIESVLGNLKRHASGKRVLRKRMSTCSCSTNRKRRRTASPSTRNTSENSPSRSIATRICMTATFWFGTRRAREAVVARISLNEVMVIEIRSDAVSGELLQTCFELGSCARQPALAGGREGRPASLCRLTVDRKVMASVMKTHAFSGIALQLHARRGSHSLSCAAESAPAVWRSRQSQAHAQHPHHHHHGG